MSTKENVMTTVGEGSFGREMHPEVNRAEINLSQLQRNVDIIRERLKPGVKLLAVVKGDAYGHGLVPVSQELESCGCDFLGVVRLTEALSLRRAGISLPILLIAAYIPQQVDWIVDHDITVMLDNDNMAAILEKSSSGRNKNVNVHVKLNTGLNRYGVEPQEAVSFIKRVKERYPHVKIEGIYTHFKDAVFNPDFTHKQLERFNQVLEQLAVEGLRPPIAHAAGSGGIVLYSESHLDMVRCGIILFGLEHKEDENILPDGVKPLMSLKSCILKIGRVRAGESGGYGDKFVASRDSRIAVVGIGYGDGISRGWKEVLISGQRVPVVNYFMDGILVDITDLKETANEFDEVVIIGSQAGGHISWEEATRGINTNIDEQLQRITERVPKEYYYEDEP